MGIFDGGHVSYAANSTTWGAPTIDELKDMMFRVRHEASLMLPRIPSGIYSDYDPMPCLPATSLHAAVHIVENVSMVDRRQVRFPRSKKKRIRRKWAKQLRNWQSVPQDVIYKLREPGRSEKWVMHPAIAKQLREAVEGETERAIAAAEAARH
ncbi:MAG: hypothetical protein GY838_03755 [bacterium]|nr:hypothetical protein [bacterium]